MQSSETSSLLTAGAVIASVLLAACQPSPSEPPQVANPASVYCQEQGGTLEIRADGDGEYGVCVFSDGTECDEFRLFDGECAPGGQEQTNVDLTGVNVVEAAGLRQAVSLDVLGLAESPAGEPYALLLTIAAGEGLGDIVAALDIEIEPGPATLCMPRYQLRFHLPDGSEQVFGYTCDTVGSDDHFFLRGDQPFMAGADYTPPADFDALLMRAIVSTWVESVNLAARLELARTVEFEILETVLTESADAQGITVVGAEIISRVQTNDRVVIDDIVAAMDADYPFVPRSEEPLLLGLRFRLDDGTEVVISFGRDAGGRGLLRGSDGFWQGRDILPSEGLCVLIDALLTAAQ